MIELKNFEQIVGFLDDLSRPRLLMEQDIQSVDRELKFFCSYCEDLSSGSVRSSQDSWVDLRGEVGCKTCGLTNRERLFYDAIQYTNLSTNRGAGLIFEKITNLYSQLESKLDLVGVEFGGYDLKPGDEFHHRGQLLEHQNMESISYGDCTFDYVLHCDVLEHVNDPIKAIKENIRVLKRVESHCSRPPYTRGNVGR